MNKKYDIDHFLKAVIVVAVAFAFVMPGTALYIKKDPTVGSTAVLDTIYVDDDNTAGPWDGSEDHPYQYIQDGIDAASSGDTVFVFDGTYSQYIYINTSLSLIGESRDNTIISLDYGGHEHFHNYIVTVTADGVTLDSIRLMVFYGGIDIVILKGIFLDNVSGCTISNCLITSDHSGNALCENGVTIDADATGHCDNKILDCIFDSEFSIGAGINMFKNTNVEVSNCRINGFQKGVYCEGIQSSSIEDCFISGSNTGVTITRYYIIADSIHSQDILVKNCSIYNHSNAGVSVKYSSDISIVNNKVYNNDYFGVMFGADTTYCDIIDNEVHNHTFQYGSGVLINVGASKNSIHHNNFKNNNNHASISGETPGANSWDDGYQGNYWDDYEERYPNATNDGVIWDTSYEIGFNNADNYPLVVWKSAPPQVTVLSPLGEELFGKSVPISYVVSDASGFEIPDAFIDIEYNVNGGDWIELVSGVSNTGEYTWEIPDNSVADHTKYLVRVGASYDGDTGYGVCDDEFSIDATPPTLNVTRPAVGAVMLFDTQLIQLPISMIIGVGPLTIIADAQDEMSGVNHVFFDLGNNISFDDTEAPYSWALNERIIGKRTLTVTVYDQVERTDEQSVEMFLVNPFGN